MPRALFYSPATFLLTDFSQQFLFSTVARMSAVCVKQKNVTKEKTLSFAFSSLETETKSCLFMKQLATTCVSNILYLRKILPANYFETKSFEGMDLKLLKLGEGFKYVDKIENWLEGAFEAIDKKYLKHLMLDIKDAESKTTLEVYTMSFNYKRGMEGIDIFLSKTIQNKSNFRGFTEGDTKLKTIRLFQMCHAVTQTCSNLPSQITLSIRLSYYDGTPKDYEPRGFKAWEPIDPVFPKDTRSIEIGVTGTNHHFFKLVNKSCLNGNFFKDLEDIEKQKHSDIPESNKKKHNIDTANKTNQPKAKRELCFDISTTNCKNTSLTKKQTSSSQQINDKNTNDLLTFQNISILNKSQTKNYKIHEDTSSKNLDLQQFTPSQENTDTHTFDSDSEREINLRCPCLCSEKSDLIFHCSGCKFFAHAECFGVLQLDSSKKVRFYCNLCHCPDSKHKCHDKVMISLKQPSDQQKLALLRRALKFCYPSKVTKITLKNIEKIAGPTCPKNVSTVVFKKMIEIGVAVPQGKKKTHLIDKHQLAEKLLIYFYHVECSSNSQTKTLSITESSSEELNVRELRSHTRYRK